MRILWLKTELLHPIDKGGKIRSFQMLKELKRDHHITYLTLDDGTAGKEACARAEEYSNELVCVPHRTQPKFSAGFYLDLMRNLASPLPYFMQKYESPLMRQEIARCAAAGRVDVMVCDFLMPSINVPPGLTTPSILFQHNVEALIWKRHFEVQTNPVKKRYVRAQWTRAQAFERAACHRFDRVVTVSREDRDIIKAEYAVDAVEDIPTGVDTAFFSPSGSGPVRRRNLVFTGSMDWLPNDDAIRYFTAEILPRIKAALPDVTLTVVGRGPHRSLIELGRRDPSIEVTGRVEDVRPYIERAAAYIVPIRIGGGTRLKIFEAMAMEKAVVSTTIGAEGLPVVPDSDLLLADTPEHFSAEVIRVLTDERLARSLGQRAALTVRERFGWARVAEIFAAICDRAAGGTKAQAGALAGAAVSRQAP